jgi:hypothetical protein
MKTIKKLLCMIMLLAVTLPATSQSLRDYIRSRAGNSDSMIIKAVSPALSLIRQQYRLERNGEYFGKNKKAYFGETYSLGIKISGGTIMYRDVMFPWEKDEDYKRVNDSEKYKPVRFESMQHKVSEKEWKRVNLELGSQYTTPFTADSLLYRHTDATSDFGLSIDENIGTRRGYMIWVYSTTNQQDSTMQVNFQSSALTIDITPDSTSIALKPEKTEKLFGGLFVVPIVERPGYIKILLAGVAAMASNNEWTLKPVVSSNNVTKIDEVKKIDKSKKKKKEKNDKESDSGKSVEGIELTPVK